MNFLKLKSHLDSNSGLIFTLNNTFSNTGAVIYITNDITKNILQLEIKNNENKTITFVSGTPVAEDKITGSSPSSLFLYFDSVLTNQEISDINVSTANWQVKFFQGPRNNTYVAITTKENVSIDVGSSVTLTLSNIKASKNKMAGSFTIDYYNITNVTSNFSSFAIMLLGLPSIKNELKLSYGFADRQDKYPYYKDWGDHKIFVDNEANYQVGNVLRIYLNNSSPKALTIPKGYTQIPTFSLIFCPGRNNSLGYDSIATIDEINAFTCNEYKVSTDSWNINKQNVIVGSEGKEMSVWILTPKYNVQEQILGANSSSVYFEFDNILTFFKPGITVLYASYYDIPGYDDGYYPFIVEKITPSTPVFINYSTSANSANYKEDVTLKWEVIGADSCYLELDGHQIGPSIPPGGFVTVSPVDAPSIFKLTCNNHTGTQTYKEVRVSLNPAKINKFQASNQSVAQNQEIKFYWEAISGDCTLANDQGYSESVPISGLKQIKVNDTVNYTLTCKNTITEATEKINISVMPVTLDEFEPYFLLVNNGEAKTYVPKAYVKCNFVEEGNNNSIKFSIGGILLQVKHITGSGAYILYYGLGESILRQSSKSKQISAQLTLMGKGGPISKTSNAVDWKFYDIDPYN